ncbi:hypothetical protein BDW71DRAFT_217869 [Aspergillus fruticulosus]
MAATASPQFTLYSDVASQWAYVAHLTIDEKGYDPREYVVKQVGLLDAENFNPEYVKINPNGTIPSLTSASLPEPLIESTDIVKHLDSNRPDRSPLFPADARLRSKVEEFIAHVHQPSLSTNLILLQARDPEELRAKTASVIKAFVNKRQEKLVKYGGAHPEIPLYAMRASDNGQLHRLYNAHEIGPEHEKFFEASLQGYKDYAAGLDKLNSMLVLPYAAGNQVTAADVHITPWLAHALWAAGAKSVDDFEPLRNLVRKSVPDFEFGENIKTWWGNISARESFKKNYPNLH